MHICIYVYNTYIHTSHNRSTYDNTICTHKPLHPHTTHAKKEWRYRGIEGEKGERTLIVYKVAKIDINICKYVLGLFCKRDL